MKIQYMSDLHLEFGDMEIPKTVGDVLVLAGDIHVGSDAVPWINKVAENFKYVLYVLGNHEFYHNDMTALISYLKTPGLFADNVTFLDNDTITIDGIKFAGTTLWTNMTSTAFYNMNDSRLIKYDGGVFTLDKVRELFNRNINFLLDNTDADVVITHQCPHIKSVNIGRYAGSSMNAGYYTDILPNFRDTNIKHWICGHTHSAITYMESNILVHNNCRGYVSRGGRGPGGAEVETFNPEAVFEIC